ncbi:MAG TPA: polyprenyl synthetase family protein [Gemmatimonadales bacterium]|nr:polyprenyl synthetase family protein [Gemmatimonadales bacterium]
MTDTVAIRAGDLLTEARDLTDARLEAWASRLERAYPGDGGRALGYALRSPGKRVRPALLIAAYRAAGGTSTSIAGIAAAVETVHTYSLVHDDLPCMDDDDLRRGRRTTHREFGVVPATRAGYLLVAVAAEVLVEAAAELGLGSDRVGAMAGELFIAAGIAGMVGGQWLDLEAEGRRLTLEELTRVHRGKTGALIRASCVLGGIAANAGPEVLAGLRGFGEEIGLAFQIADDVLDATGTSDQLGKTPGRDRELAKSTYVSVLGVAGAMEDAERHARQAVHRLDTVGVPSGPLGALARYIVTRSN